MTTQARALPVRGRIAGNQFEANGYRYINEVKGTRLFLNGSIVYLSTDQNSPLDVGKMEIIRNEIEGTITIKEKKQEIPAPIINLPHWVESK